MPTVRWNLRIASLGSSGESKQAAVEAKNWMQALRAGRQQLGENDPLPPGVTCTFAPDGTVILIDPVARLCIVVEKAADPGTDTGSRRAGAKTVDARKGSRASIAEKKERIPPKRLTKTVAFGPAETNVPGREIAVGKAPDRKQPNPAAAWPAGQPKQVSVKAPLAKVELQSETAVHVSKAEKRRPAAARERKPSAGTVEKRLDLELMLERNEEPTEKNPLTYRERAYLVPKGSEPKKVENRLREVLAGVQKKLDNAPRGKLVNLAAFDHQWKGHPRQPPVVIIQWKDWRGEPQVAYPKAVLSAPPPAAGPETAQDKLANAFEALHDLFFLDSPVEGLQFVIDLLKDMVPAEAYSTYLYDIDTNELRCVVLTGPEAEQRKGKAIPLSAGLLGHAARQEEKILVVSHVASDEHFDPAVDGREGLTARNMLVRSLVSEGRLLGVLQLINRLGQPQFSSDDANLINYVAKQLSKFLHSSRLGLEQYRNKK